MDSLWIFDFTCLELFLKVTFQDQSFLTFDKVQFINFSFMDFNVVSKNSLPNSQS